jgi:1-deoxy-D-xylulose-5-phosphate reductoisomerase
MIEDTKIDILVVGIVGSSALLPVLTAIPKIKIIALANKEALVMAGDIIMREAVRRNTTILPLDSEHSAVFQCIDSSDKSGIKRIYITGSGGPLFRMPKKSFKDISPQRAVNHPKLKMGRKISVDSATMMNKGLEVIEAHHLFGLDVGRIEVLIHPETLIHSMVEFIDGSILAQMGTCDMRTPIQYALTYPSRCASPVKCVRFNEFRKMHFYSPDLRKFPCLEIAYEAARRGGTYPSALNASNEVAVAEFLKGRMKFTDIPKVIEKVVRLHKGCKSAGLEDILDADEWARGKTREILGAVLS